VEWTNQIWAASLDLKVFLRFFETFCGHAPRNKLCGSTNFIIFGPIDQSYGCLKILGETWGYHVSSSVLDISYGCMEKYQDMGSGCYNSQLLMRLI
jgi:hypothetical protein